MTWAQERQESLFEKSQRKAAERLRLAADASRLAREGLNLRDIARRLGVPRSTVEDAMRRVGARATAGRGLPCGLPP